MKTGSGAGMRTGTQAKVGYNSGGTPSQVNARPRLRTYKESMQPATSNKTTSGKPRTESARGKTSGC